jgi:1A family penicillin-binding protein
MPLPQLKKDYKDLQSWRDDRQKYFNSIVNQDPHQKNPVNTNEKKQKQTKKSKKKKFFLFLAGFFALILIAGIGLIVWLSSGLPDPNHLIDREVAQSTKIYDRTGETVLYEISGEQKRTLVDLNNIPNYVKQATISIEDKNFYNHGAISFWGIFRGVVVRAAMGKSPQGGSTLTQQFVKNAILTSERSITRKLKEWILSYRLEQTYDKDQILQMYFNEIPYGSTAYGVQAASQHYFGKNVGETNLAEAAILAALPQSPSRYSPYGTHKDLLISRQHYILDLMVEQGYIKKEEAEAAKTAPLEFKKQVANITAPHFVMYIKEILSDKYGEKTIEQGGLKIITTLDLYKQNIAEEIVKEKTESNEKKYNATNAALISIDPKTGQILAMVGSKDYYNDKIDGQVNITTSARQPGSSLKPLVYASAFLKGYTPNTVLYDVITNFSNDPAKPYEPHNYDSVEHGPISMRKALAGSLNVPAVKTIYLAGIDNVLDLAKDLGYTTLTDRDRYGLSLVLGGGEVKLIEHANAYSAFAREGYISPVVGILKVTDAKGNVLEEFKPQDRQAIDPKIAREINDVLSDNNARSYIFGSKNWLTLNNRPVAAKTGTTNDYRDAWTMGYTPSLVTGVWVGNSDNTEMKRGSDGSVVAAPIWHDYMQRVLGNTPVETFKPAEIPVTGKPMVDGQANIEKLIKLDKVTGKLATEFTPPDLIIEKKFINEPHCILYYIDRNNPLGDAPKDPSVDPQFHLWEGAVKAWADKINKATTTPIIYEIPPTESDDLHTTENIPTLEILSPASNDTLTDPILRVSIETSAKRNVSQVEYYINENLLATIESEPFNLEKDISFLNNGFHNLKVKACDDVSNCQTKNLEFNLNLANNTGSKELSVSIFEPSNGLALSNIDFPFNIKLNIKNPSSANKIDLFYKSGAGVPILISSTQSINTNIVTILWDKIPASGTYKIYAEATAWTKEVIKTDEVIISINNINKETPSEQ